MATAEQLLMLKGGDLVSLGPEATVSDAVALMHARHIGSILVVRAGEIAGIFTERDLLERVVACEQDPHQVRLAEVMTSPVACAAPHTSLDEIRLLMRERFLRHIPVIDGAQPVGMISMGDLNRAEALVEERSIVWFGVASVVVAG